MRPEGRSLSQKVVESRLESGLERFIELVTTVWSAHEFFTLLLPDTDHHLRPTVRLLPSLLLAGVDEGLLGHPIP